jgi:hypothetical protein
MPDDSVFKDPKPWLRAPTSDFLANFPLEPVAAAPPDLQMVEVSGFEPLTPCLQSRCSPS